jgi:hypothetical protein
MNQHIKRILLLASILALLAGIRDTQSQDVVDPNGTPRADPPPGAQIEPKPTPTPEGNAGDVDQVLALESIQVPIAPTGPEEPVSGVAPENIPGAEELDAILDRVNRGGPERPGSDGVAGEGPGPGTESRIGPVGAPVDTVNRGGPERPGSDEAVGKGPEPGSESDTEQRFSLGRIWTRFVQTLRNWWHELRT